MSSNPEVVSPAPSGAKSTFELVKKVSNNNKPELLVFSSSTRSSSYEPEERCFIRSTN